MKNIIEKWYKKLSFPSFYDSLFEEALSVVTLSFPKEYELYNPQNYTAKENLLAHLFYCEELEKTYKNRGIGEDVLLATLSDIVLWTNVWYEMKGELGLDETAWLSRHFSGKLYRLGRLQFCLGRFENNYPAHGIKKDENVIEVHIPADGKLSFEECTASFTCARAFFARYFPNFSYRFYSCHSWLLDTSLKRFVGENSNVYLFGARFEEIDKNQDDAILRYVFRWDAKRESLDNFPAKSTLARALKGAVENGEAFYEVLGIIPKENV